MPRCEQEDHADDHAAEHHAVEEPLRGPGAVLEFLGAVRPTPAIITATCPQDLHIKGRRCCLQLSQRPAFSSCAAVSDCYVVAMQNRCLGTTKS